MLNSISRYYCAVYEYKLFSLTNLSVAYAKYNNFVLFHFTPNYKVGTTLQTETSKRACERPNKMYIYSSIKTHLNYSFDVDMEIAH